MKKRLTLILTMVLVLALLAACVPDNSTPGTGENGNNSYRIAMVANAPIDDGGWNASVYQGMCEAAEQYGFETAYSENVAEADYVSVFTNYANAGFDLVFAPGNEFTDAVEAVAPKFPDVNFVIMNGSVSGDNYISIKCDNTMCGFLAGVLAGLKTQTGHVGFVGGTQITTGLQAADGFEQGVAYVNPDAEVHVTWSNSWDDAALGKEIAISMISTYDVDVFFGVSSAVDAGVREGAFQYDNRWAIAQPSDYLSQNPDRILTSIITDNAALIGIAMKDVIDDTFGNEVIQGGVADHVLLMGEFGTAASDIQEEFTEIYQGLEDGTVEFAYNVEE